jgi:hypothetical protein
VDEHKHPRRSTTPTRELLWPWCRQTFLLCEQTYESCKITLQILKYANIPWKFWAAAFTNLLCRFVQKCIGGHERANRSLFQDTISVCNIRCEYVECSEMRISLQRFPAISFFFQQTHTRCTYKLVQINLLMYSCNCICCFIVCSVSFIVCVVLCAVFCLSVVCYFVCCPIVLPLPPGLNPFAV